VPELFSIETDRVSLSWGTTGRDSPWEQASSAAPPGQLMIRPLRKGLVFGPETRRTEVPADVASDPAETVGPRLYEESDYTIFIHAKDGSRVALETRDPSLMRGVNAAESGRVLHGVVNFRSQVGLSEFVLRVGTVPEFAFTVEVFPSKLDYHSDYQLLLAEVQEILTGLALEYLRSTFHLGAGSRVDKPSQLEWLTLLRHVADELDQAITVISQRPQRVLVRELEFVRAERVRRADAAVRNAIVRTRGAGAMHRIGSGLVARRHLPSSTPRSSLDTPEHRWLASQLVAIRRGLAALRHSEAQLARTPRRDATLAELDQLLGMVARLARAEPIASAVGPPPAGFASLPLLKAPGYREAYRACLILSLGLRIEGGPIKLSLKDLSELYEYWCFLALLRLIGEETGEHIPVSGLISVDRGGLCIRLQRGQAHVSRFTLTPQRAISVTFNPSFPTEITPQRPDIMITVTDRGWPGLRLVLDAKYRLDSSPEYVKTYGVPGPPDDAINVLHRYRDAILDWSADDPSVPMRTIVQAAALFPSSEPTPESFHATRLWRALETIGIGAVPFLPTQTDYMREWLRSVLRAGSWTLADRAIAHRSQLKASAWRFAAAEPVLVGTLRAGDEAAHLRWILESRAYYVPLLRSQRERHQYATRFVALYSPTALRTPGALTHVATVSRVDVVRRDRIATPWHSSLEPDRLCILYRLDTAQILKRPIVNQGNDRRGDRFSTHRWTTKLALDRARTLEELFLETEQEWRLYEDLVAANTQVMLRAGRPRVVSGVYQPGRAWFVTPHGHAQFRGAAGFILRASGVDTYVARPAEAASALAGNDGRAPRVDDR